MRSYWLNLSLTDPVVVNTTTNLSGFDDYISMYDNSA